VAHHSDNPQNERQLRELVAEQAALRRVAVLVARGAAQQDVFDAVSREVGELMRADTAGLLRLERSDEIQLISGYSPPELPAPPVGLRSHIDRFTATKDAILTGRPSRSDATMLNAEERTPELRSMSLQSAIAAPITVAGYVWGAIAIARRSDEVLPPETEARMGEFAELAAQAIANAEARHQLAASRARIVQAGDEARRRIERNLHDGAQQRIVSLALLLRVAEKAVAGDDRTSDLLRRASEELRLVAQELRELARGIHPAILVEHGLSVALEALVSRTPVPVTLEALQTRLPAPVEATTYYVVAESLTNIVKYAQATSARVVVRRAGDALFVEVADDGTGGARMDSGGGLRGLADRVDALHGTLRIDSPAGGGTLIAAVIPLAP
jgi:signal transduction histidine kinase